MSLAVVMQFFFDSCMSKGVTSILTFGANMKKLKILPGAAGLIALTATIGFVDGQREVEVKSFSRSRITLVRVPTYIAADGALPGNQLDIKSDNPAYLVQIRRGNIFAEVLIDAFTGRMLLS